MIGGLNASIIAGSKEKDHPEKALEQFWLELAEGSSSGNPNFNFFPFMKPLSSAREHPMSTNGTSTSSSSSEDHSAQTHISQLKSLISFYSAAIYGNKKSLFPDGDRSLLLLIQSTLCLMNGLIYMTILH